MSLRNSYLAMAVALLPASLHAANVDPRVVTSLGLGGLPLQAPARSGSAPAVRPISSQVPTVPLLQAGHPSPTTPGITPDSPANRVIPNTPTSPFAGVGSIFIDPDPADPTGFICTGTPISRTEVITAGHCFDTDGNGSNDVDPENVLFVLNYDADYSHIIPGAAIHVHPDFDGFGTGSPFDDLTVLLLSEPLPPEIPTYALANPDWLAEGTPLVMVGYGDSGTGLEGYTVDSSFNVKRGGANLAEVVELDDEGGGEFELVAWDFEYEGNNKYDPVMGTFSNSDDYFGYLPYALPNGLETTLGGGDSGGPSFMFNPLDPADLTPYLAAVNTFSFWDPAWPGHDKAGRFGSGGGAVWLNPSYQSWIASVPDSSSWALEASLASMALAWVARRRAA